MATQANLVEIAGRIELSARHATIDDLGLDKFQTVEGAESTRLYAIDMLDQVEANGRDPRYDIDLSHDDIATIRTLVLASIIQG